MQPVPQRRSDSENPPLIRQDRPQGVIHQPISLRPHYVPAQPASLNSHHQRVAETIEAATAPVQQQQVRVFIPKHDPSQPQYLNGPVGAGGYGNPSPVVRQIATNDGNRSVAMDLSQHTMATDAPAKEYDWGVVLTGSNQSLPNSSQDAKRAEETAKRQQEETERQKQLQKKSYELRQRRVQSARHVVTKIVPGHMGEVDREGGKEELVIEAKAKEIWYTIAGGLKLAVGAIIVVLVGWVVLTTWLEHGAETRMMAQLMSTENLHRPSLLSKLDPNYHYIATWVRQHFPPFFGTLEAEALTKGLDSVVHVPTMVDPSEWGMGNWFSRGLGRLFFHGGPRHVEQAMSMRDLDLAMRQAARETKLSCLCAAHMGIPVHAVLCRDTFMMEPTLERASLSSKTSRIRDELLWADDPIVTFPHYEMSYVDFISKSGRKVRETLHEERTRCVTYCTRLAERSAE